jgi:DNA-binding PucR family transcriptional regulator
MRADALVGLIALGECSVDAALAALRGVLQVAAGASSVVSGLAEVDIAYWQATLARRTLPGGCVAVVELEERLPEALLLSSPELAERLIERWLGPVMKLPASERRALIDTLETWVLSGGSVRRTAELAHCHRNTVLNRLHRITQLTGREFDGGEFEVELALALRAARLQETA